MSNNKMLRCVSCGSRNLHDTSLDKTTSVKHDGKVYEIHVPAMPAVQCGECGEVYLDNRADLAYREALRAALNLLKPEEIRAKRLAMNLSQEELAEMLRVAKESLSRWENGHVIQSRSHETLLRAFFEAPELRAFGAGSPVQVEAMNEWDAAPADAVYKADHSAQRTSVACFNATEAANTQYALAA